MAEKQRSEVRSQKSDEGLTSDSSPASSSSSSIPHSAIRIPHSFRTRLDADQGFGEAIVHKPLGHVVLGHRLRPYSYWHAAQLDYLESPFAGYEGRFNLPALFLAVRVCQLSYPHTLNVGGTSVSRLFAWLREMWVAWRYGAWLRTSRAARGRRSEARSQKSVLPARNALPGDAGGRPPSSVLRFNSPFLRELNKFSAYLRDYNSRPIYGETGGQPSRLPWYLAECALARRFDPALTWEASWNMEVGAAAWQNAAMLEAHGNAVPIESAAMRAAAREAGYEV